MTSFKYKDLHDLRPVKLATEEETELINLCVIGRFKATLHRRKMVNDPNVRRAVC